MQEINQAEEYKLNGDGSASNSLPSQPPAPAANDNPTESRHDDDPLPRSSRPKKKKKISKNTTRRRHTKKKVNTAPAAAENGSASNHQKQQEYCERALPTAKPLWESVELHGSEIFHAQIDQQYFCRLTPQHQKELDELANFRPAHINQLLNENRESSRINEERAIRYLQFLEDTGRQHSNEVVVLCEKNDRYFQLFFTPSQEGGLELRSYLQLNPNEYLFLKLRKGYLSQLEAKLQLYSTAQLPKPPVEVDQLTRELLFFNSLLLEESRHVKHSVQELEQLIANYSEPQRVEQEELARLQNDGMRFMLRKNLVNSLLPKKLDVLNYFRMRAAHQQNKSFEPLSGLRDLQEYIRKKMVRKNKKTKYPLPTGCLGCLSDRYEQANPFKNCYECGSRFHKNCLAATYNVCTVCDGKRLRRTLSTECQLCPNRGIMYKRLENDTNIHVWCMLAFNLYEVRNLEILYRADNQDDVIGGKCFLCDTSQGRFIKCLCSGDPTNSEEESAACGKLVHPLCAYLHGYHLRHYGNSVQFNCQLNSSSDQLLEQEFFRKYTVNFNKTAYRFLSLQDFEREKRPRPSTTLSEPAEEEEGDAEPQPVAMDAEPEELFLSE